MTNTMSKQERGSRFEVSHWRMVQHRVPSLHRFVSIKMSSNAKSRYWNVEVEVKKREREPISEQ